MKKRSQAVTAVAGGFVLGLALGLAAGCNGKNSQTVVATSTTPRETSATDTGGDQDPRSGTQDCSCTGKQCGPDGCDGTCGSCPDGVACGGDGQCVGCVAPSSETLGGYLRFPITWGDNIGLQAGSGVVHMWFRDAITFSGGTCAGQYMICGVDVPELTFTVLAGAGKMKFDFPDATFELASPPMQVYTHGGSSAGFDTGAAVSMTQSAALFGCTMTDPSAAWPLTRAQVSSRDDDGDQKPGSTAQNRNGNGYVYPPADLILPLAIRADKLYISARMLFSLNR